MPPPLGPLTPPTARPPTAPLPPGPWMPPTWPTLAASRPPRWPWAGLITNTASASTATSANKALDRMIVSWLVVPGLLDARDLDRRDGVDVLAVNGPVDRLPGEGVLVDGRQDVVRRQF